MVLFIDFSLLRIEEFLNREMDLCAAIKPPAMWVLKRESKHNISFFLLIFITSTVLNFKKIQNMKCYLSGISFKYLKCNDNLYLILYYRYILTSKN